MGLHFHLRHNRRNLDELCALNKAGANELGNLNLCGSRAISGMRLRYHFNFPFPVPRGLGQERTFLNGAKASARSANKVAFSSATQLILFVAG